MSGNPPRRLAGRSRDGWYFFPEKISTLKPLTVRHFRRGPLRPPPGSRQERAAHPATAPHCTAKTVSAFSPHPKPSGEAFPLPGPRPRRSGKATGTNPDRGSDAPGNFHTGLLTRKSKSPQKVPLVQYASFRKPIASSKASTVRSAAS